MALQIKVTPHRTAASPSPSARVDPVRGWRFHLSHPVDGTAAAGPIADHGVILRLVDVTAHSVVSVTPAQGKFSFKLADLPSGKVVEPLDGAPGLVRCLVAFNGGVELGPLAFIAPAYPLVTWLRRGPHERRGGIAISVVLDLLGAVWFTDRAFKLGVMPF